MRLLQPLQRRPADRQRARGSGPGGRVRIRENASLGRKETIMTTANTMTTTSITKPIPRRTMLGGMAGAGALSGAWPYLAPAQQGDINIGVLLAFTGSHGAYGPDMRQAAHLSTKIVNDAAGARPRPD